MTCRCPYCTDREIEPEDLGDLDPAVIVLADEDPSRWPYCANSQARLDEREEEDWRDDVDRRQIASLAKQPRTERGDTDEDCEL